MNEIPYLEQISRTTEGLSLPEFAYSPPNYTNEEAIAQIRQLPYLVTEHRLGTFFNSGEDKEFCSIVTRQYEYTADWLEFFILGRSDKLPELTRKKKDYKPLAYKSVATLNLIKDVVSFCPWLNNDKISVNRWWLLCEWERCLDAFNNSGYLGKPSMIGGRAVYQDLIKKSEILEDGKAPLKEVLMSDLSAIETLEGLAYFINQNTENFDFGERYRKYLKDIKSVQRQIRNSPLNPTYILEGELIKMGKGQGRKGQGKK